MGKIDKIGGGGGDWQNPKIYVLNLDRSPERWKNFRQSFEPLGLDIVRVAAVDGKELTLPHPDYDERRFQLYHGKRTSRGAVGCYFSHIQALRQFLESDEETALICEDDVSAKPELPQVLREVLSFRKHWDLLRLNCLLIPTHVSIRKLNLGYRLTVPVYWSGGAGAYLVNRKAAERIITFSLPMYLPYDHAFEQNWRMDFTIMMTVPFPIVLNENCHRSTIGETDCLAAQAVVRDKLSFFRRYLFSHLLPYRGLMTSQRWRKQLGTALWYRLFPPSEDCEKQ
jgi:glycosyl transferase family 25